MGNWLQAQQKHRSGSLDTCEMRKAGRDGESLDGEPYCACVRVCMHTLVCACVCVRVLVRVCVGGGVLAAAGTGPGLD